MHDYRMDPLPAGLPDLESLPRIELVSLYMNRDHALDEASRHAFREEFARRGLPLPKGTHPAPPTPPEPATSRKEPMDRRTLMSYMLLIYTVTGVVYSWIYLATRLVNKTGVSDHRHRAIMTLISLVYVAAEALVFMLIQGE